MWYTIPVEKKGSLKLFLASGFFLGLSPVVPGSFGALTGLAWHLAAVFAGWSDLVVRAWCLGGVLFFRETGVKRRKRVSRFACQRIVQDVVRAFAKQVHKSLERNKLAKR